MEKSKASKIIHIVVKIFILLVIILALAILGGSEYLVKYAIGRDSDSGNRNVESSSNSTDTSTISSSEYSKGQAWATNTKYEDVSVDTTDNLKLNGRLYDGTSNHDYVILVHGYHSDMQSMYSYGKHYYDNGYNVLLIDLRSHGSSEGKYIGMGWLDKDDILKWINMLSYKDPDANIILHGVSMGAATVMMVSGEDSLPSNIKAIIEDCGYTDAYSIFSSELTKRFSKIPSFPTMDVASLISKFQAGYSFKEASALEQVKKSDTPIFFIHGTNDDFVPCDMVDELSDAANCAKDIYKVDGAGHAQSKDINPDEYFSRIFAFIDKYNK